MQPQGHPASCGASRWPEQRPRHPRRRCRHRRRRRSVVTLPLKRREGALTPPSPRGRCRPGTGREQQALDCMVDEH